MEMTKKAKLFTTSRIIGIVLIAIAFFVFKFKPSFDCSWWNIICHAGNILLFPLQIAFTIISLILLVIGLYKLVKG